MWESFLSSLFDFIAPPRQTQILVRTMSLDDLQQRLLPAGHIGILPYHDSQVRALVWELKYYANKTAAKLAAALLYETILDIAAEQLGKPLLIPMPMHKARQRARGHNQTEVLCKALLPFIGAQVDYAPDVLMRIKNPSNQQGLEKHVRLTNVAHSMVAGPSVAGRVCIVVDDVSTTGATCKEAARALKQAGARHVEFVAIAQS